MTIKTVGVGSPFPSESNVSGRVETRSTPKTLNVTAVGTGVEKNVVMNARSQESLQRAKEYALYRSANPDDGHRAGSTNPSPSAADLAAAEAKAKFDREVAAHENAVKTNLDVKTHNAGVDKEVKKWTDLKSAVDTLANMKWDLVELDGVITDAEMAKIASNAPSPYKEAAQLLLANPEVMAMWPKVNGGFLGLSPCVGFTMSPSGLLVELQKRANNAENTRRTEVPVPPHPGNLPAPSPSSDRSPAVGGPPTQNPPTPGGTPPPPNGSTPPSGPGATPPATAPKETEAELKQRVFKKFNQLPPFSTDAKSAEGRMEDGVNYLQKGLDALNDDLVAATLSGNQGEIMMIQNKIQKMQAGLSALMQMMKQQQEMLSNMSKMFNEMAMSSIRNMR